MKLRTKSMLAVGVTVVSVATIALGQGRSGKRWEPAADWFEEARIYERPKAGYIAKKETAIAVGRAVITGAYGPELAKDAEPLDAKLFGDVWVVYSFFPATIPPPAGGVTTVEISKTSGSILSLRSER